MEPVAWFMELVAPDRPNPWEVEDAVASLAGHPHLAEIMARVPVIWPVSNSLCFNYLGQAGQVLDCLRIEDLDQWVRELLDQYEQGGLRAAQAFMLRVEEDFVCRRRGEGGVRLGEIEGWLLPFIQGLSEQPLHLAVAEEAATDTETVYLPAELSLLASETENSLLYKLMAACQWGFIRLRSFLPDGLPGGDDPSRNLARFFDGFADPVLAARLYHCLEAVRVVRFLRDHLPGLMRRSRTLRVTLADRITGEDLLSALQRLVWLPERTPLAVLEATAGPVARDLSAGPRTARDSCALTEAFYPLLSGPGPEGVAVLQGRMILDQVAQTRQRRYREMREELIEALARTLAQRGHQGTRDPGSETENASGRDPGQTLVLEPGRPNRGAENRRFVRIDNHRVELDPETRDLVNRMEREFGPVGAAELAAAEGRAGQYMAAGEGGPTAEDQRVVIRHGYDEWDYRRRGYRKNWCLLEEKPLPLVQSTFVESAMNRYRGVILRMRRQFEMLRTRERFLRRQRDGDDIDLDSLVESLADTRAGLPPSDRLFIRLRRDERDIAVVFLVDMSNSTEGWVGTVIKESLVVLCEGLETVGDRYGIYGFSGMRRLRCEVFPVKAMDEPYSDQVRRRIGSIAPREYTRMAPAIRHMSHLLSGIEARIRLLLILSDGKPEDYDDYKGEYAIEDTRHALLESRLAGIHPFCITIDREARDYMARIFGRRGYTCIHDVRRLPVRVPEIYRILTS